MKRLFFIILISFICQQNLFGQTKEANYYVNTFASAGYGVFLTDLDAQGLNNSGFNGSFRIMWQPEHLLSLGLETGFIQFYTLSQSNVDTDFGVTDIDTKLNAVPILIVYSMKIIDQFQINLGSGLYMLYSTVDSHNNKVTSTQVSSGFMLSGSYSYPLNNSVSLGGELKWNYVNKINDGSLSLQFVFKYVLVEY